MSQVEELFAGVSRLRLGAPEAATPVKMRFRGPAAAGLAALPDPGDCPLPLENIRGRATGRGYVLEIPLADDEELYGFGLQLQSFRQKEAGRPGKKKMLRVNSDPVVDTGDSHAPAPFYVSTRGYGVLVDTARYATFYCGCTPHPQEASHFAPVAAAASESAEELYATIGARLGRVVSPSVNVEVPHAAGADDYVFWGEDLRQAVQRYNLFSGGGCLPPHWGLGVWYRVHSDSDQDQVRDMAQLLRDSKMPCDVLGLEPGWQTQSYPCTFAWSNRFPDAAGMLSGLKSDGFEVNLWTHVFTHPESELYRELMPLSGDYTAFGGLVPDMALPAARAALAGQHDREHVSIGVSGYKLDECDNSDFIGTSWSFPEITTFPSALDGEQMHSMIGLLYQETIESIFQERNQRTYNSVRSTQALAAPYPFVLYSDLYGHREFIRGLVNAGFAGMLWSPEVRNADSAEDLVRRLQTVVCSPQALINCWYIKNPPWRQWDTGLNNLGQLAPEWEHVETICRGLLNLRMQLVPYLYAAFARYYLEGLPPFRALVMDYPHDPNVRTIDDQYMMGDFFLVAPIIAGHDTRSVYLPAGDWYDFWTGAKFEGGQSVVYNSSLQTFPLFVKSGSVLPLAEVTQHTADPVARHLTVRVYGDGQLPIDLIEDDGLTYDFERGPLPRLTLSWDGANDQGSAAPSNEGEAPGAYRVIKWEWIR